MTRPVAIMLAGMLVTFQTPLWSADVHVSPEGSPTGSGGVADPIDLATAFSGASVVAGDTVWLHGGDYLGSFTSYLSGNSGAPIVVRAVPGESPRIDGVGSEQTTLSLHGSWTEYHGFETGDTSVWSVTVP